jgi:dipeptidyl aminopeptidase/acylaminoacyl peptidase
VVPYAQSLELVKALKAKKATVWMRLMPDAGHDDPIFLDTVTVTPTITWLHKLLDRK